MAQPNDADKIDAAIGAAQSIDMAQVRVTLNPNGRPAVIIVPKDVTDFELLALMGQVLQIGDQLRAQRPSSGLVVVRGASALPRPQ